MLQMLRSHVRARRDRKHLMSIYEFYKPFTMIPPDNYVANLSLARTAASIPGAVVECGVWRGGMIAGLADILGPEREYVLCDSFEGLPPAKEIDGPAARAWQQCTTSPEYHDNCTAPIELAKQAMSHSSAKKVRYVVGWFDKTLPELSLDGPIAVLRLDGDWYDSTIACLSCLAPKVQPGGLILVDDYHTWDGCTRAVHDYLAGGQLCWRVSQWNNSLCYIRLPRG
jgi:O-methyltransferase